ncbi:hypothetical protein IEQ34_004575 [Dendrobium chrysotoxum]|uniref:Uncharacterized protein n=1 Tax=Dendrobium chrysotoxum TaxID=161865 RepID=A0AAV7HEP5_DENCH|nr:hypothetical protein IEQ34_004575 [Dendrobium chrysotoxum]
MLIEDVASSITSYGLIVIHKKFDLPTDFVMTVPKKIDQARDPPSEFITLYEKMLHVGLRFPPDPKLLEILWTVTIIVGLTIFYSECGVRLTIDHLSKMCKLTSDFQGRVLCRGKKSDWGLPKKWGSLQDELRHISQYVLEEKIFKVGLSIQAGRSDAVHLKNSNKVHEANPNALKSSSNNPSGRQREKVHSPIKKRRVNDALALPSDGEMFINICLLQMLWKMDVESQFDIMLDEWNAEFMKCRAELTTMSTTSSLHNREADRSRTELIEAHTDTNHKNEALKAPAVEKNAPEIFNRELQDHLLEKEAAILDADAQIEEREYRPAATLKEVFGLITNPLTEPSEEGGLTSSLAILKEKKRAGQFTLYFFPLPTSGWWASTVGNPPSRIRIPSITASPLQWGKASVGLMPVNGLARFRRGSSYAAKRFL